MKIFSIIFLLFTSIFTQAQIVTIPDANFKNALLNDNVAEINGSGGLVSADTNNDGEIQESEALTVTGLQLINYDIDSLEGIQSFINVTRLLCQNNNLTTIDVSQNTLLEELWVSQNELSTIDVSSCTMLSFFVCQENQMTTLDVTQNPNLQILRASFNLLEVLDVSQNLALEVFWCSANQLTSVDIAVNSEITNLSVGDNLLTDLNLQNGNNSNITRMWAQDNPELGCILVDTETATYPDCDITNNTGWCKDPGALYTEDINDCNVVPISDVNFKNALVNEAVADIDGNGTLEDADTNNDGEIQVIEARAVIELQLMDYEIASLAGLEQFTNLTKLLCQNNNLTAIDISSNTAITNFSAENNQLTSLNLRNGNNENMLRMWAFNNPGLLCILVDDDSANYPDCDMNATTGWCKDANALYGEDVNNCTLGLNEYVLSSVTLSPNPTKDYFIIDLDAEIISQIEIFNVVGHSLKAIPFEGVVDLSEYTSGLYFIQITAINGKSIIKKVIKE